MTVSLVQGTAGHPTTANPSTTTGTVTAGDLLVIAFSPAGAGTGTNYPTVTIGGVSQTVNQINSTAAVPFSGQGALWCYVVASTGGTATINFVQTASANSVFGYAEFSGLFYPAIDTAPAWAARVGASSWATPTATTTIGADLLVAWWGDAAGTAAETYTPPSGWTQCFTPTSGATNKLQAMYYQAESATGSYSATLAGTTSISGTVEVDIVAFALGPNLPPPLWLLQAGANHRAALW